MATIQGMSSLRSQQRTKKKKKRHLEFKQSAQKRALIHLWEPNSLKAAETQQREAALIFQHWPAPQKDVLFCLPTWEQLCLLPLGLGDPLGCSQREKCATLGFCVPSPWFPALHFGTSRLLTAQNSQPHSRKATALCTRPQHSWQMSHSPAVLLT